MTDDQVERLIWKEIKKKDITIHDMIGLPGHGISHATGSILVPLAIAIRRLQRQGHAFACEEPL